MCVILCNKVRLITKIVTMFNLSTETLWWNSVEFGSKYTNNMNCSCFSSFKGVFFEKTYAWLWYHFRYCFEVVNNVMNLSHFSSFFCSRFNHLRESSLGGAISWLLHGVNLGLNTFVFFSPVFSGFYSFYVFFSQFDDTIYLLILSATVEKSRHFPHSFETTFSLISLLIYVNFIFDVERVLNAANCIYRLGVTTFSGQSKQFP